MCSTERAPAPQFPSVTIVQPYGLSFDRKSARIRALGLAHANALENVECQAGYIEEWPAYDNYYIAQYVCDKHLAYDSRFTVLTFLTMNRCPPILLVELMEAASMLADQAAADHALSMLKKMARGEFNKYRAYVMETKTWMQVYPPCALRGDWAMAAADWSTAVAKLQSIRYRIAGVCKGR